jgi:hypothetical protein
MPLRWAEEAEAKHVFEWAGLERASGQPEIGAEPLPKVRDRPSWLRRLRGWFGNQTVQIARDD